MTRAFLAAHLKKPLIFIEVFLDTGNDTLKSGLLTRDDQHVFFIEVGIKITRSYSSYFIYIFDHHPQFADYDFIIRGLESLVNDNVEKIDPSEIADKIDENKKGGHMIN